jgi:hypothetical protein
MLAIGLAATLGAAPVNAESVPPARDGNIAIKQELCAARAKATVEAYDLFIARHPHHPLVKEAKAERRRLIARGPSAGKPRSCRQP